jgi:cytochrome c
MILALAPRAVAQGESGSDLFEDRCAGCHFPAGGGQGPNLSGIVGHKAGSVAGFTYTAALKDSGLVWTSANLDRFLTDPGKLVPGTAMPIHVPDAAQRQAIISYLATTR